MKKKFLLILTLALVLVAVIGSLNFGEQARASKLSSQNTAIELTNKITTNESSEITSQINSIINFKKQEYGADDILKSKSFLSEVGKTSGDWLAFSLARYGYEGDYSYYLGALSDFAQKKYATTDKLSKNTPTEWHRLALAITAAGGNSQSFGEIDGKNIDLYNDGIFYKDANALNRQGLPAYIWALITINALDLQEPQDAVITKQDIVEYILSVQMEGGGFKLTGEKADADLTSMAITALSAVTSQQAEAGLEKAITTLSGLQNADGTFSSMGIANAASTAWAVVALTESGINLSDSRFVKNADIFTALKSFSLPSGGYCQGIGGEYDSFTTNQVLYAYVAMHLADIGSSPLFDLNPVDGGLIAAPILINADKQAALAFKDKKLVQDDFYELTRLKYLIFSSAEYDGKQEQLQVVKTCLQTLESPPQNKINITLIIVLIFSGVAIACTVVVIIVHRKKKLNKHL